MGSTSKLCQNCNEPLDTESMFCESCGQRVPEKAPPPPKQQQLCRNCSSPLMPDSIFCESCGKPVNDTPHSETDPSTPQMQQPETVYKETVPLGRMVLAVIVTLIISLIGVLIMFALASDGGDYGPVIVAISTILIARWVFILVRGPKMYVISEDG